MQPTELYQEIIDYCQANADPEKKVRQGLGWFLREAWKLQPAPIEAFLLKYKDTAPRLIYQYACEKMGKDEKLKFRRNH